MKTHDTESRMRLSPPCAAFLASLVLGATSGLLPGASAVPAEDERSVLWYEKPAAAWNQALPLGNGRLGAMVYGGTAEETIALNEDTIWSGGPHDYTQPGAHRHLAGLRKLILDGKYDEAAKFGAAHSLGVPPNQKAYQSLGRLLLTFPGHEDPQDYRRELDMADAIARVNYRIGDTKFTREMFSSHPDQVIAMLITSDQAANITFSATFTSAHEGYKVEAIKGGIVLTGGADQIEFQSRIHLVHEGGSVRVKDGKLLVKEADSVLLLLAAATNHVSYKDLTADPAERCGAYLAGARGKDFETLKSRHVMDFRSLYDRVSIDLGGTAEELKQATDELLKNVIGGRRSALLEEQLFRFGRYLNISGARPGTQPLNLVGIWAEDLNAPWGGKWTLNINAELNTWPVETTNLAECHEPLLGLLEDLRVTGRKAAKEHYNCRGFVAHHNTDLWRGAAPVGTALHGLWTMGSAWLCRHIWEHYDFSRDTEYLKKAYPTMKEAALFYQDFLMEIDGYAASCPAISFEQGFKRADGRIGRLTYGPTMDNQILRDHFDNCIMAAEALDVDATERAEWKKLRDRLRPTTVDPKTGRLMEWAFEAEKSSNSGQTAPLWGASPGRQINFHDTPELAAAAVKHLEYHIPRMPVYETGGSWVTGTLLNAWTRLGKAEPAYATINRAMRERLYPNLMMHFYTKKYFQIDGNMGTTAGITEMLLQSQRLNDKKQPVLDLLPALPGEWSAGSIRGIRARGAFNVDLQWSEGTLVGVKIESLAGTPLNLTYRDKRISFPTKPGQVLSLNAELQRVGGGR